MTWGTAESLVVTLRDQRVSDKEIIQRLCKVADRYRDRSEQHSKCISGLRKELIDSKKESGRIIQVTVDSMQTYGYHKVVWYRSQAYTYHGNGVWRPVRRGFTENRWPDEVSYAKYKVWIEVAEQDRDIVCSGKVTGFLKDMTCITLDPETQRKMYLGHGDKVVVTKVRK